MKRRQIVAVGAIAAAILVLSVPVPAAESGKDEGTIPSTAVARLKIGKGTAWVRTGDSGDWQESVNNYPLAARARVSVPEDSEAEIQFHGSQSLKLQGGSEVDILELGDQEASYRLRSGKADLSLPQDDFVPVRFKVPGNREVRAEAPGRYVLSVDNGGSTFLVRAGKGAVTAGKDSPAAVNAGEEASIGDRVRVSRVESGPPPEMAPEPPMSEAEEEAGVPPAAADELRQYGEWVSTPEYGYVWRPYVEDGWEPYYYGRWAWVSPYGWTWVGYEPWGWWPYHTGWWWPSPVFGWVWCPFNSFVSVDFFFGGHVFHGHHARFFRGNVRFTGRGDFVRWVPARPGVIESRSGPFSRGDSRLARWDRPVDRGAVMVRRDGGRPVAWEGRTGTSRSAVNGMGTAGSRNAFRSGGSSVSRTRDGGAVRGRSSPSGTTPRTFRQGDARSSAIGRGSPAGRSRSYGGTARSSAPRVQVSRPAGGSSRGEFRGGFSRGFGGEGFSRGFGGEGFSRGFEGRGSARGFSGGGSRR